MRQLDLHNRKIELLKKNNLRLVQRSFDDFENRTI